ncbi:DUF192 domain-containing protein [Nanoarchaeota archaeon]
MEIIKNRKVIGKGKLCDDAVSQTIGLMFSKSEKILIFKFPDKKMSIHTFFCYYPLDLVYLSGGKVIEICENLKTYSHFKPKNKASFLIEAPSGFVKNNQIQEGSILQLR